MNHIAHTVLKKYHLEKMVEETTGWHVGKQQQASIEM